MRSEGYFDTVHRIESPEGVILELHAAGPMVRLAAWLLDSVIRWSLLGLLAIPAAALQELGMGLWFLAAFAINWLYFLLFELLWRGATVGKRAFGLQVLRDNGMPLDLSAAVIRNLMRSVDFLPVFFTLGLGCMLFAPGFRRLGDLAAGTIVVYRRRALAELSWRASAARPLAPLAPRVPLDPAEQRAIVRFGERSAMFGAARARELAGLVAPFIDPRPEGPSDPAESLSRIALWISGRDEGGA